MHDFVWEYTICDDVTKSIQKAPTKLQRSSPPPGGAGSVTITSPRPGGSLRGAPMPQRLNHAMEVQMKHDN